MSIGQRVYLKYQPGTIVWINGEDIGVMWEANWMNHSYPIINKRFLRIGD